MPGCFSGTCHLLAVMLTEAKTLTSREKKLLRSMALGLSDHEIAIRIGGTEAQVATQRLRLLVKLNICSECEIAEAAERLARWPSRKTNFISKSPTRCVRSSP
jgi:DNA-binding NarL/FixJ family response regulator